MNSRVRARGGRLRPAAVAACATLTLIALGAGMPSAASAAGPTLAGSGNEKRVRFGDRLQLSGRLPAGATSVVQLEYAPGGQSFRAVSKTTADASGAYRFSIRPRRSGRYRTVSPEGFSSTSAVTVVARLAGRADRHVRAGSRVGVRGRLAPGLGGRRVRLELATARGWRVVDRTLTGAGGRYRAVWRASQSGRYRLRVRFAGDGANSAVSRTLRGRVYVYRPGLASWYGPGLYGNPLGCGGTLTYGTLGVAHKSLPCGTKVTVRYRGRSITVPVVDRGPYVGAREFDLTSATKSRIGFGSVGTVWVAH